MKIKIDLKRWLFIISHAFWMIFLTLLLQQSLYLYKDESSIIQLTTFIKHALVEDWKPDPSRVLFINTSYDNALAEEMDETGLFPIGNSPITDRQKLIDLIGVINQYPEHEFLILDIFFEKETPDDENLVNLLNNTPRNLSAHFLNNDDQRVTPRLNIPTAAVSVRVLNDQFTKFRLSHGSRELSLPLDAYIQRYKLTYTHGWLISKLDNKWLLNTFFLNYCVNTYDLLVSRDYPMINLGELLMLGEDNLRELISKRWVVVGDFVNNDNIETLFGTIPGPLLLYNVVMALERGDMTFGISYWLFLFVSFCGLSMIALNPKDVIGLSIEKLKFATYIKRFIKAASFAFLLTIISVSSFLIFHIHINILLLSLYLYGLDYLIIRLAKKHQLIVNE